MKITTTYTLDTDLVEKLNTITKNKSGFINDLLREKLEKTNTNTKELREKKAEIEEKKAEIEEKIKEIEEKNRILEENQRKNQEILKIQAQERLEKYKKNVDLEISYFPTFIKNGFLSTQAKREKHFKSRAKLLGIPIEEYLTEIVSKAMP